MNSRLVGGPGSDLDKRTRKLKLSLITVFFFSDALLLARQPTQPKKKIENQSPRCILICKPVVGCALAFHSILQVFD